MPELRRRNTLIGLATIVFGTSGFIVSGAFEFGSRGSLGSEWVQVASADQTVPAPGEDDLEVGGDDGDGGDGEGDGGDGGDGGGDGTEDSTPQSTPDEGTETPAPTETPTTETPTATASPTPTPTPTASPTPVQTATETPADPGSGGPATPTPTVTETETPPAEATRVQVIREPDNDGNYLNRESALQWDGQMAGSETMLSNADGLFRGFTVENANRQAVSRVGFVDAQGYPTDRIAFLVVNVGDTDRPGRGGQPVDIVMTLRDDDGRVLESTDQITFPYRVVNQGGQSVSAGRDLLEATVRLPVAHVIEVVIEVDATEGIDDLERLRTLTFSANSASGS